MATNDKSPLAMAVKIVDPTTSSYQVQVFSTGQLSVSGSVTATISTSGNQDVNIARVNGQTVTASSGTVSSGTMRMTLATNDPAVTALEILDNTVGPRIGTAATSASLVAGIYNSGSVMAPTSGQQVVVQLTSVAAVKVGAVDSAGAELNYSLPVAVSTGYPTTKSLARGVISSSTFTGATVLVPSSSGQTTRVHRIYFAITTASAVRFLNGSTAMTGDIGIGANGTLFFDLSSEPWFATSSSQSFGISATVTTAMNGSVEYITS